MTARSALVTGARGFVGQHLTKFLANTAWDVHGIGHGEWTTSAFENYGLKSWQNSSIELRTLRKLEVIPDVVFHCAGTGSVAAAEAQPELEWQRTVGSTHALVEWIATQHKRIHLVLISSAAVYGTQSLWPIHESAPLRPVSVYGRHKCEAEKTCLEAHIDVSIVRFFSIYGPGLRKQLLWEACQKMTGGEYAFAGTGEESRDWIHIDDAVTLLASIADRSGGKQRVVNGGSGFEAMNSDVLTTLAIALGCEQRPIFTGKSRPGDPDRYLADVREAIGLGWHPQQHWRNGVRQYASWFLEEGRRGSDRLHR